MKPLGNDLLGATDEVPYTDKYIPPYQYTPAVDRPAYREEGIYPLKRPPTRPKLPYRTSQYLIPPALGPQYVQGPIGDIVPVTHAPYPQPPIISDREIIVILTSKNLFHALQKRGMATMAGRRQIIDANTRRAIYNEVTALTKNDIALLSQGRYTEISLPEDWQREAIKWNLVKADSLRNLMGHVAGVQVWPGKEGNLWPSELKGV